MFALISLIFLCTLSIMFPPLFTFYKTAHLPPWLSQMVDSSVLPPFLGSILLAVPPIAIGLLFASSQRATISNAVAIVFLAPIPVGIEKHIIGIVSSVGEPLQIQPIDTANAFNNLLFDYLFALIHFFLAALIVLLLRLSLRYCFRRLSPQFTPK